MKGIILAGGLGTRLHPLTLVTSKQLLPIYDKPMIYYPLSVLMQAGIREVLIISTPHDLPRFEALFGDGSHLGIQLSYAEQEEPRGIAEAFIIGESFIGEENVALILGDNIFYGNTLPTLLKSCSQLEQGGIIFGYQVKDPQRYGVLDLNKVGEVVDIIEKPAQPPSSYAVTGLYFYDNEVVNISKALKPSPRGELEITDVNRAYLARGLLRAHLFDPGFAWLDTGTFEALHQASNYVQAIQERQGVQIGSIEAIARENSWISNDCK
ncbi:glucose-1-phosphate thymidylyltransferase RfbA [Candidatus Neptunochlamydia vexilliferae]|nr:glucose-1-phosphate thymidylyltransferase RfbA [Candidatus Neptunochlamydia vexilliferae]